MKHNKQRACGFVSGVLATLLTVALVTPVFALATKKITVETGVKVYVDDHLVQVEDAYGNPMDAVIWDGRTYLPVKAITDAMDIPLKWEGKTFSVYVGKHNSSSPSVWLQNLDHFYSTADIKEAETKDNLGDSYANAINFGKYGGTRVYKLNGKYRAISGTFYQMYSARDRKPNYYNTTLKIYGDDELLYEAYMEAGIEPIPFKVDLTGVLELKVVMDTRQDGGGAAGAVGEFGLWT